MANVFGYIRVSTAKQGKGVSLVEQKSAITIYAKRHNLTVVRWFEELETAAKSGRPVFSKMVALLKKKNIAGVIIHKIDRSARNMRDWSDLTEMADVFGLQIHFVQESVNLLKDNDRLSADMQAVVASHYIRNLRQETIKGLYGRLKQGIYPFNAPIGYLNDGSGKPKIIDPIKGPLVKKIFRLYLTEQLGIIDLANYMYKEGLRNNREGKVTKNGISKILNNPFYAGIMKVKGKTFLGKHEPLISVNQFELAQNILIGKTTSKARKHDFTYSRLIKCAGCGRSLIGEVQKGINYYRCHTKSCSFKCIREDSFEKNILDLLENLELSKKEADMLKKYVLHQLSKNEGLKKKRKLSIDLQISQTENKIDQLLDLLLNGVIETEAYEQKNQNLLIQLQKFKKHRESINVGNRYFEQRLEEFIELTLGLHSSYIKASKEKKRYTVKKVASNLQISPIEVDFKLPRVYWELTKRNGNQFCDPERDDTRTFVSPIKKPNATDDDTVATKKQKTVNISNAEILKKVGENILSRMTENHN